MPYPHRIRGQSGLHSYHMVDTQNGRYVLIIQIQHHLTKKHEKDASRIPQNFTHQWVLSEKNIRWLRTFRVGPGGSMAWWFNWMVGWLDIYRFNPHLSIPEWPEYTSISSILWVRFRCIAMLGDSTVFLTVALDNLMGLDKSGSRHVTTASQEPSPQLGEVIPNQPRPFGQATAEVRRWLLGHTSGQQCSQVLCFLGEMVRSSIDG